MAAWIKAEGALTPNLDFYSLHLLLRDSRFEWDHASGNNMDKVKEHTFGPEITNVEDVELRIKQAQKAVLNPGDMDKMEKKGKKKSYATIHSDRKRN